MHMEFHIEHYIHPNIPFHKLARFRREIDGQMPAANRGLWDTYREIIQAMRKQRQDASYFVKRETPRGQEQA